MPRLLFEKTGSAVWVSHLDLMRLFQRGFKRAGLPLTHTKGFNPRPSVSIALPMSVGIESRCELLDFDLEGVCVPNEEILLRLNQSMIEGIRILSVYDDMQKIKHLALLKCQLILEYDAGIPEGAETAIRELFGRASLTVEKRGKNGPTQQDIIPMIKKIEVVRGNPNTLRVTALVCCQNPTLNPMQLSAAVEAYIPEYKPDFVTYARLEIYDAQENVFR